MGESAMLWAAVGVAGWVVYFGGFGWYAAGKKGGEPIAGAVLGILGGPMGVILTALLPSDPPSPRAIATQPARPERPARRLMGEVRE